MWSARGFRNPTLWNQNCKEEKPIIQVVFQKSWELLSVANNEEASIRSRQPFHENRFKVGFNLRPQFFARE